MADWLEPEPEEMEQDDNWEVPSDPQQNGWDSFEPEAAWDGLEPENWDQNDNPNDWIGIVQSEVNNEPHQQMMNVSQRRGYETLQEYQIEERMEDSVAKFGELLNLSPPFDEARLLLQFYEWSRDRATNDYFMGNQEEVRINAGIDPPSEDQEMVEDIVECPICLEELRPEELAALTCGHNVCLECWSDYIREEANRRSCFKLKCPVDNCPVAATTTRLRQIGVAESDVLQLEERQNRFRLKSYTQSCKDLQACLGPDCNYVQKIVADKNLLTDIVCECGFVYCIQCLQPGHRPCPCEVADNWIQKATSEAENMQWILAKTKKCPKCRVPIEKNQGCNHMTCRAPNCKHEFCWLCKGDWKEHGSATGGFYKCNIYEKNKEGGNVSNEEKAQEDAKSELERYSFYFTRYDNHIRAISQMKKTLENAEARMGSLMSQYRWKPNEASFIKDASNTIMDCRRLLAWTYPIGYYMEENFPLRDLFHQYQKDLEVYTEHLHELAEQPLETFRDNEKRSEVINYQRVIQKYRDNLIRGIEKEINPACAFCR